jgi:hypothetical protein
MTGAVFGEDFVDILAEAVRCNHAIHDGAVMLGRASPEERYEVSGWSHRLHPPATTSNVINKGSAFNSCAAMSCVSGVDALFLIAREGTFVFCGGDVVNLFD